MVIAVPHLRLVTSKGIGTTYNVQVDAPLLVKFKYRYMYYVDVQSFHLVQ